MRPTIGWLLVALSGASVAAACGGDGGDDRPSQASRVTSARDTSSSSEFERLGGSWQTDFSNAIVSAEEFISGGPGKDGIPAIDEPRFVSIAQADFLDAREPVVVVEVNGEARAYPVQILIWHEIVNDVIGGEPVLVTYCPLCNSAVAFSRTVDGMVYDFGVSGFLRNSDLVMYDRQTETWWQQITGEALVGGLTGKKLDFIPSSMLSFADFVEAHPDGIVLSRETGFERSYGRNPYVGYDSNDDPFLFSGETDGRLDAVDRVVAVEVSGESAAYAFSRLEEQPAVNDVVGGVPIVVLFERGTVSPLDRSAIRDSADVGSGLAYKRTVDGLTLTFEHTDSAFRDNETGSQWDITGRAVAGPLEGRRLEPIVHGNHFWFAWVAFKPETRVWEPEG